MFVLTVQGFMVAVCSQVLWRTRVYSFQPRINVHGEKAKKVPKQLGKAHYPKIRLVIESEL